MRQLAAHIEDVFREAAARWTLLAYFILSSLFILVFALAVNLDIVDGALAGAKLFGKDLSVSGPSNLSIDQIVLGFESGFSVFIYLIGTFLAVFATAHLVPRLQDKGTIDLYLSRPIGRVRTLLYRYVAGMLLSAANVVYLIGTIWLIIVWKTHVVHPQFLLGSLVILFVIATLLAFAFLVGVVTSSTAVSIMGTYGIFLFSAVLAAHEKFEAAVSKEWQASAIRFLYNVMPKTSELGRIVVRLVSAGKIPQRITGDITLAPFLSTAIFALCCLALASWTFHRKEF